MKSEAGPHLHFHEIRSDFTRALQEHGRTSDLMVAIHAHRSYGSEANAVVRNFNYLGESQKQDVLNFLRSL